MHTQVAIIGAGPAGLTLAALLHRQGISSIVLERHDRTYIETRTRAGILEQPTVDLMHEIGVGDGITREGMVHNGFYVRFDRTTHHLDFTRLVGGHATVYPQQKLVADLVTDRVGGGEPLLFEASVRSIDTTTDGARLQVQTPEGPLEITADFVAGCDGFHGVSRAHLPADSVREFERTYPVAWLGILAHTTPTTPEGMYCAHENGISVHSMRGPNITRQYLQVPADTDLGDWSDERIWDELTLRSASDDFPVLERGEIFDKSLAPLRSYVCETMQHGRLFLLGDAAHIVPPTGAKGLNLAVSDAVTLSYALGAFYLTGGSEHLDAYSSTCLPRIWKAQHFSAMLTETLHSLSADPLDWQLRRARLTRWVESEHEQSALGEVYLGLPFPSPWRFPA
ncbi:4-hydroxybenzoate 3-monooxygenase [Rhodococcus sp. ACPA4]|uniref:4-hydroxybenzoate 3-monooxygenase n=1 Tax=Rhodococcus sp. ACPA4 TaxID=2028571 RepID=UPI000BB119DC|nr:4-hydroxybenzoate 3-monooxygenase [Rhodococcus sp. ACPA4]PBC42582.1 4-hydroxybenzoate 3-monooxygenase [Rhodococcus sp. ACPA4]